MMEMLGSKLLSQPSFISPSTFLPRVGCRLSRHGRAIQPRLLHRLLPGQAYHPWLLQPHSSPFRSISPILSRSATKSTTFILGLGLSVIGYQLVTHLIRLEGELLDHYRDTLPQPPDHSPSSLPSSVEASIPDDEIESILSIRKLSFGTLTGICVGIFVRKGLTFLAFLAGGGFIILQYLHSKSLIKIDWKTWSNRYDSKIRSIETSRSSQSRKSITARFLEFLTSDFQYRSTFLVGFCLGLRIA